MDYKVWKIIFEIAMFNHLNCLKRDFVCMTKGDREEQSSLSYLLTIE